MSNDLRCGDPAALAGYLYDECEPAEREWVVAHLATCAACTAEVAVLRATREQLAVWTPPDVSLGFRLATDSFPGGVTRGVAARQDAPRGDIPRPSVQRSWHWSAMPAWAQAAAAVLLFAVGASAAALMSLEVRYDRAGLTVRTGWQKAAALTTAPASAVAAPVSSPVSTGDVASLETRIREELKRILAEETAGSGMSPVGTSTVARGTPPPSDDLLRRVRDLVTASEEKQQRELAFRVSQVLRDVDSQRRADITRIERTVGPMQGITTEEVQQQRRMLNYLMTVSETK